jgi:hypothetical protein
MQSSQVGQNYFLGFRKLIDTLSDDFKRLRHDLVGSLNSIASDIPFSAIDPNYDPQDTSTHQRWHRLTPDYWVPATRVIAELGTTLNPDEVNMKREYDSKWAKYSSYTASARVNRYFVFIVSPSGVTTNFPLTLNQVDELCMRCRLGIALETRVIELLGTNPFINEDSKLKERLVQHSLASIGRSDSEDQDFNHDLVEFSLEDMTSEESKYVMETMKREFLLTSDPQRSPVKLVDDYLATFTPENTHQMTKLKRVINFPMVIAHRIEDKFINQLDNQYQSELFLLPEELGGVWRDCFNKECDIPLPEDPEILEEESARFVKDEPIKHIHKKHHTFKPNLTHEELLLLAQRGIGGKTFKWNREMKEAFDLESHKGFSPLADTTDIEDLLKGESLTRRYKITESSILMSLLKETKMLIQDRNDFVNSVDIFEQMIHSSEIICFADMISCIAQELTLTCKVYTPELSFTYKYLRYYKVGMVVKNTGSHIFVSFLFDKADCTIIETGRIGPKLHETEHYIVSDWCSFDANHLEQYMKCGPLMAALMCHYLALFKIDITNISETNLFKHPNHDQFWTLLKSSLLIFLNNKLDLEELLTAQRYFTMNILDEVVPDPYRFCKRLPTVIRSRLTSYYTKRTIDNMHYYNETRISKTNMEDALSGKKAKYYNLKSILCPGYVTIEQAIELFYIGYLVSKNRSSGAFASFTICKKLFSEEFKYLKNREIGKGVFSTLQKASDHQADRTIFKFYVRSLDKLMQRTIGPSHKEVLAREIITKMANTTFLDLATLKASARPWEPDYNYQEMMEHLSSSEVEVNFRSVKAKHKQMDPSAFSGRPKAILALSNLMEEFRNQNGRDADHTFELVPFCLERLEREGGFNTDLFSKDQHGGIREITVMEITARILQYFVEVISRVVCKHFESETLTSPENKEKIIPKHYASCSVSYSQFITLCTSGDKKTWCQGHHSVRFANMLTGITHTKFHNMIYRILRLWVDKRVKLPSDLVDIFLTNQQTKVEDPIFNEMRSRFYSGSEPFIGVGSQTVRIRSGMFQGLLHYASSVQHTMCQEVTSILINDIWKDATKIPLRLSVAQGSDDYVCLYSFLYNAQNALKLCRFVYRLIRFRARMTHLTGITDSDKTAHCILDTAEYNSEWTVAKSIVRPTLKWVIASLEISLVENFITRLRQFNNNLTQVIEGGGSTLECSLIQLSQAWLHYKLLGIDHHHHFYSFKDLILRVPDPAAGFFPLEADLTCGLPGLDYVLYTLAKKSGYGTILATIESLAEADNLDYNGRKTKTLGEESRAITIKFSDPKNWKRAVDKANLPSYDEVIHFFTENPEIVFSGHTSWAEDKMSVALKFYSPGVRSSLSGHQPLLRMMVAASYILNRPCFRYHTSTVDGDLKTKKWTLLQILRQKEHEYFVRKGEEEIISNLKSVFPRWEQYDKLHELESTLNKQMFLEESSLKKRGKVLLEIFPDDTSAQFPLLSLCQRKWFGKTFQVKVGSDLFNQLWISTKLKYSFIKDTIAETLSYTGLNVVQLKFFIEATSTKGRSIKLMDTSAKTRSLYSTITRIFWDSIKVRAQRDSIVDQEVSDLKSALFSIITFPYKEEYKISLIESLIKQSIFLQSDTEVISSSSGLQLFREILTHQITRDEAILKITRIKEGAIGWFSIRQKYNRVTGIREGPGEWRGRLGPISCIITLEDNFATHIVLNTLNNMDQTTISLTAFLREIRVKVKQTTAVSPQNFYFKPHKGIIRAEMVPESHVSLQVDSTMVIDRFDKVEKTNWRLDCTPYAIRLINVDSTGVSAVLLSERISSRHWDRDSRWPLQTGTLLHHWHKGSPASISKWRDFCQEIMILNTGKLPFDQFLKMIRKTSSVGFYDLPKMELLFSKFFSGNIKEPEALIPYLDRQDTRPNIDSSFLISDSEVFSFLSTFTDVEQSWGDTATVDYGQILPDVFTDLKDGFNEDMAIEQAKVLMQFSESFDTIPQEVLDELSVGMPLSNHLFSSLNHLLMENYPNVELSNLLHDETPFEDTFGLLLSLISGKDKRVLSDDDGDVLPVDSISRYMSTISGISIVSSIARQETLISELVQSLMNSSGILFEWGQSKLRKEEARLRSMKSVPQENISADDLKDLKKVDVTVSLLDTLKFPDDNPCPRDAASVESDIYWARIVSELVRFAGEEYELEEISEDLLKDWLDSIKSPYANSTYWSIWARRLNADIAFGINDRILYTEPVADSISDTRVRWLYDLTSKIWVKSVYTSNTIHSDDEGEYDINSDSDDSDVLSYVE